MSSATLSSTNTKSAPLRTSAESTPPGSEVQPRDVNYVYGDADPERVTALVNVGNGLPYASFTYDAAGNMKSRCLGAVSIPVCVGESLEYVYDGKDQLRRVTKKNNGVTQGSEEYWYDGFGARLAIVRRDNLGNKTELVTFTGDTEAHYDGVGALQYVYSHLSMGTPIARIKRTNNTTSTEYQFHGLATSTLAAVGSDGTINASFSYAPFGSIVEATDGGGGSGNGVEAHPRRHNDKFADEMSGLAYYGARYYDKTLIGWTQADPIYKFAPDSARAQPRRAHLYSMALNNPLRYVDPDGRSPKSYAVVVQDLTHSQGDRNKAVTALAVQTIQDTFKPQSGGLGDLLLQGASQGTVSARVSNVGTQVGKASAGTGSRIMLVNLKSGDSEDSAKRSGAGAIVEKLRSDVREIARAEIGGANIVIAIDRIIDRIQKEGLDINNKEDREKIAAYIERIVVHEVGHNLGLCHDDPCGSKKKRDNRDLMSEETGLDSAIYSAKSKNDIDKLADSVHKRAF